MTIPPIVFIALIYVLGVVVTGMINVVSIQRDPSNMPGGGWIAVGITAALWPVVLVAAVLGMLLSL